MYRYFIEKDRELTVLVHNAMPHNGFFDSLFSFLSLQGTSFFIWAFLLIFLIVWEQKKHKRFFWQLSIAILSTFVLTEFLLKNIFERTRPTALYLTFFTSCPSTFSFPSGHSAVAFAASTVFSHYDKKRIVFYYILAFLISLSRIYLGCHYLIDLLGGAIVGIFVANLALHLTFKKKR